MSTLITRAMRDEDVLLVIDVQRDFCNGGNLPVPDGDAVVPEINQLSTQFQHIVLTQDWHPAMHRSFASAHSHEGRQPYETVPFPYGEQTLWPDHCVQSTPGADFHPELKVVDRAELILRKGFRREIDSYSAFRENDKKTPTGLAGYLRERGFKRIFLAGLAYDYCVRFSAVDGQSAGFESYVIWEACRAIGLGNSVQETNQEFERAGVRVVNRSDIEKGL